MIFFIKQFLKLTRQLFFPLFIITVFSGSLDQIISLALENELRSPEGATPKVWYYASASLANSLVFPWIETLLLLFWWQRQQEIRKNSWLVSWSNFVHKFASQSLIETLRAWGKCLIYSLLLIIPGLWKFLEYIFVPWVVCFHPKYEKGEVDALKAATQIFRKSWLRVLTVIFFFVVAIPLTITSLFEEYRLIWITPLPSLGLYLLNTIIQILCFQFLTIIFFKVLSKENFHESHI